MDSKSLASPRPLKPVRSSWKECWAEDSDKTQEFNSKISSDILKSSWYALGDKDENEWKNDTGFQSNQFFHKQQQLQHCPTNGRWDLSIFFLHTSKHRLAPSSRRKDNVPDTCAQVGWNLENARPIRENSPQRTYIWTNTPGSVVNPRHRIGHWSTITTEHILILILSITCQFCILFFCRHLLFRINVYKGTMAFRSVSFFLSGSLVISQLFHGKLINPSIFIYDAEQFECKQNNGVREFLSKGSCETRRRWYSEHASMESMAWGDKCRLPNLHLAWENVKSLAKYRIPKVVHRLRISRPKSH